MPASPKLKLIFIHIPKTSGSAIEQKMNSMARDLVMLCTDTRSLQEAVKFAGKSYQHFKVNDILRFLEYNNKQSVFPTLKDINVSEYQFVTVVRNPYTRFASEIRFQFRYESKIINPEIFNNKVHAFATKSFKDWETDNNIYDNHITPQYMFLNDPNINVKIIKYEELSSLIGEIDYISGERVQVFNSHYTDAMILTPEIKTMIANFYAKDFSTFNYPI